MFQDTRNEFSDIVLMPRQVEFCAKVAAGVAAKIMEMNNLEFKRNATKPH